MRSDSDSAALARGGHPLWHPRGWTANRLTNRQLASRESASWALGLGGRGLRRAARSGILRQESRQCTTPARGLSLLPPSGHLASSLLLQWRDVSVQSSSACGFCNAASSPCVVAVEGSAEIERHGASAYATTSIVWPCSAPQPSARGSQACIAGADVGKVAGLMPISIRGKDRRSWRAVERGATVEAASVPTHGSPRVLPCDTAAERTSLNDQPTPQPTHSHAGNITCARLPRTTPPSHLGPRPTPQETPTPLNTTAQITPRRDHPTSKSSARSPATARGNCYPHDPSATPRRTRTSLHRSAPPVRDTAHTARTARPAHAAAPYGSVVRSRRTRTIVCDSLVRGWGVRKRASGVVVVVVGTGLWICDDVGGEWR